MIHPHLEAATEPDSLSTRHSLLNRIKDLDDHSSWREFFEIYWELIYNVARKAGLGDAQAQDVVQETVIAVSRNISAFRTGAQHGSFKAWLLQQTRWQIAGQFRKQKRSGAAYYVEEAGKLAKAQDAGDQTGTAAINRIPDPATLDMNKAWEAEWEKHTLRIALEKVKAMVSAKQFQMFDLHISQGLSVTETARAVRMSVAAVYMASSRLRRLVRREVRRLKTTEAA
jgi:RNA polymerase sigma factor (sigma-70 family)